MSHDTAYTLRQAQRDAQHAAEYKRWVDTLPEEDRAALERLGIEQPDISYHGTKTLSDMDLAESSLAASGSDVVEQLDGPMLPEATAAQLCSDVLASFCARMRGCANPALVFDAVCYGTGVLAIEGQTATELAAKHGVTKQAFSKIAVEWCTKFGLPPARSMKSKRARAAYRRRARAVHQRHKLTRPTAA